MGCFCLKFGETAGEGAEQQGGRGAHVEGNEGAEGLVAEKVHPGEEAAQHGVDEVGEVVHGVAEVGAFFFGYFGEFGETEQLDGEGASGGDEDELEVHGLSIFGF